MSLVGMQQMGTGIRVPETVLRSATPVIGGAAGPTICFKHSRESRFTIRIRSGNSAQREKKANILNLGGFFNESNSFEKEAAMKKIATSLSLCVFLAATAYGGKLSLKFNGKTRVASTLYTFRAARQ